MADGQERLATLRQMHGAALNLELRGDFARAHEKFAEVLWGIPETSNIAPEVVAGWVVLRADSIRDDSFTSLRQVLMGLRESGTTGIRRDCFDRATRGLHEALEVSAPFVTGTASLPTKKARSELWAAQAKTQGCLGRLVVARQIVEHEITLEAVATNEQREAQHWFSLAHKTARSGNSAYVGANNAMLGARTELVDGTPLPIALAIWPRRAFSFLARVSLEDHRGAARTIGDHARDLTSREQAMHKATHWRHV